MPTFIVWSSFIRERGYIYIKEVQVSTVHAPNSMQPRSDPTNLLFYVRPEQPPFPPTFVFFHRPSSISLVASRFLFTPFFPLSTFDCLHLPASNPIIRSVRQEPVAPLQTPSLCHLQRRCFNSSASRTLCTDEVFNSAPSWIANMYSTYLQSLWSVLGTVLY